MLKIGANLISTTKAGGIVSLPPPVPTTIYTDLYDDNLIDSFANRQLLGSRTTGITYANNGKITFLTGSTAQMFLLNFDAQIDKYPSYDNGFGYPIGDIVYGGYYGHGLFQRTGNPGNPGYPPIITQANGTQDESGWTRYRPTDNGRLVNDGDGVEVEFAIKLIAPAGPSFNAAAQLRFGLFDSHVGSEELPKLINNDGFGSSNSLFGGYSSGDGYRGYMTTTSNSALYSRILYKRSQPFATNLITSSLVYTQMTTGANVGMSIGTAYSVYMSVTRLGNSVRYFFNMNGVGNEVVDANPLTYNFDVLAGNISANVCASFELSNFYAGFFRQGLSI